ncbi:MAG: trypsin-like peptidase domain-containing protein [Verrucomicrobiales bacterium]|nr:trypsin-like peptidase domain-containing protein [Verrucomicrobiales bacterium]
MKSGLRSVLLLAAGWALLSSTAPCALAQAADLASKGREVFAKHRDCVVTVQLVIKTKMNIPGFGGGDNARESREEVTGTVIDPSGLTVVALSSVDPMGALQGMMGGLGGDDGEGLKMKMESDVADVKVLGQDGTEIPAEIVLRDKDLDLAFLRPKAPPSAPMKALDLTAPGTAEILDEVIAINRLGKVAGRAYSVALERICAVVRKPRLFYVPGNSATSTSLGCPAFTADGKVVGVFVMRSLKSGGEGMSLFNPQNAGMTAILLPAEEVRKIAAQVPATGAGK